ncbi:MAG: LysR substrate-binding domain-containing protein [Granulosicoccus sp.]
MRHLLQLNYVDTVARVGSIRRAAETLAITSTALNRRILALEDDLGTPIFERMPNGVRLNVAGELFIQHVRQQLSDMERVKSQIADLSGVRRGHVSVACGQALMIRFLPAMVSEYRALHPGVSFSVLVAGRQEAAEKLIDYSADIALIYEPEVSTDIQVLLEMPQQMHALLSADHPLAGNDEIRFSEIAQYPLALPSTRAGIRHVVNRAANRRNMELKVMIESDSADFLLSCVEHENMIAFQLPVAFGESGPRKGVKAIPVCAKDVPCGSLQLCQQKGRNLSVAAARFAAFVTEGLQKSIFSVESSISA